MKSTRDKKTVRMAKRFTEIKKLMKILADEENEIKKTLKAIMHDLNTKVLVTDEFAITLTNRFRTDLDKEILEELLGDSIKNAYTKTEYQIFEIKSSKVF